MFPNPSSSSPHWSLAWKSADTSAERLLQQQLGASDTLSEPEISRLIARAAFSLNHTLFLANSMPVRDFDSSAESFGTKLLPVFGNRGASGIDGNIATIAGVAMASDRSVLAVIGDLAALHDLNSLPLLLNQSITLVIVNNHGGGIFRFLPLAVSSDKERNIGKPLIPLVSPMLRPSSESNTTIPHQFPPLRIVYLQSLLGRELWSV